MNIQYNNVIVERKPDTAIVNKMEKAAIIIDVAMPGDNRITDKEKKKIGKYQNFKKRFRDF